MAVEYGLQSQGFVSKPLSVVQAEIDAALQQQVLGTSAGTEADGTIPLASVAGQIKSLFTDGVSAMWDLLQAVVAGMDPTAAAGRLLDVLGTVRGTLRSDEKNSTVTASCTGDPGTVLDVGQVASVPTSGSHFDSQAAVTIATLVVWQALHAYSVGDRRTHASRVYVVITAGTSAASGGPTTTDEDIIDGTVHWRYVGEGTGVVDALFQAEDFGPVGADSGQLSKIETPVTGWKSVKNLLDALPGRFVEEDPTYRLRQQQELVSEGDATEGAIRTRVLKAGEDSDNPITSCRVFANDSDTFDGNGQDPHSVQIVVEGGEDDNIDTPGDISDPAASVAAAIWSVVAGGIKTVGTTAITITDSAGNPQVVRFRRPAEINIWISLTVIYDPKAWPSIGAAALVAAAAKSAILTYASGTTFPPGYSVDSEPLAGSVNFGPSAVDSDGSPSIPAPAGSTVAPGIIRVDDCFIGTASSPTLPDRVPITPFQIAKFDSSRIVVNAVAGSR